MKFPFFRPFGLSYASGVLPILAPAVLAGTLVAVVLTVASSEAAGPPPALGSDFNLPLLLEQGRPAPVFMPRSPQSLPTPTATPAPVASSP